MKTDEEVIADLDVVFDVFKDIEKVLIDNIHDNFIRKNSLFDKQTSDSDNILEKLRDILK